MPTANTGSGGRHFIFRWPTEGRIANRKNHHGLKVDVRGTGGYFVAAPSRNMNGEYVWETLPGKCEPAEAPAWLLAWVRSNGKFINGAPRARGSNGVSMEDRAIKYLEKMPPAISGQGGHDRTLEAARVVVYGFNLGSEIGYRLLADYFNPRCDPPWSERELRHKCQEADTVPFGKPRGWLLDNSMDYYREGRNSLNGATAPKTSQQPPIRVRPVATYQPFPLEARLLSLDFAELDGKPVPLVLRLSDDAKKVWVSFYNEWAAEQAQAEGELAAAYSKLEGYAARFALIHHIVTFAALGIEDAKPVGDVSMEAGIALAKWFAGEARRIYSMLAETPLERELRRLVEFISSRGGSITVRQLQRSNSRKYPDAESAEKALNDLAAAKLGDWQEGPLPEKGGHRICSLILRPTHDTSDARFASDEEGEDTASDSRADTRSATSTKHGEDGQVSEVSCVGQGVKKGPELPPGSDGAKTERRSECREREPGEEG